MDIKKQLLTRILEDLNITPESIMEAGLMSKLGTWAGNAVKGIGNTASGVANTTRNASNTVGDTLQTDNAIIKTGLLFTDPNAPGKYIGIKGIKPGTPQADYFIKQYERQGYKPATADDRIAAMGKPITIHSTKDIVANLKDITANTLKNVATTADKLATDAERKDTISSPEAGGMYQQVQQQLVNGIHQAQAAVGGQQVATAAQTATPTPVVQTPSPSGPTQTTVSPATNAQPTTAPTATTTTQTAATPVSAPTTPIATTATTQAPVPIPQATGGIATTNTVNQAPQEMVDPTARQSYFTTSGGQPQQANHPLAFQAASTPKSPIYNP